MTIAFTIIPFRQRGGRFFYYFLILALAGPVEMFIYYMGFNAKFGINQNIIILLAAHLSILALHYKETSKKFNVISIFVYIILTIVVYYTLDYPILFVYFILVQFVVLTLFLKYAINYSMNTLKLNLFHAVLILYLVSVIGKYLSLIISLNTGYYYFLSANIFHTFVAFFFIFVREDNPKFNRRLTNHPAILRNREDPDYLIHDRFKEE